jgi:hypothetical protein
LNGRCLLAKNDGTQCNVRWIDIMSADYSWIDQQNVAHIGGLNAEELRQIKVRADVERAKIARATGWA